MKKEQHEMENPRNTLSWVNNTSIFIYSKNSSHYLKNTLFQLLYAHTHCPHCIEKGTGPDVSQDSTETV